MATERLSMRKIREILRCMWALGWGHREVASSLGVSVGAVSGVEHRARAAGLEWGLHRVQDRLVVTHRVRFLRSVGTTFSS